MPAAPVRRRHLTPLEVAPPRAVPGFTGSTPHARSRPGDRTGRIDAMAVVEGDRAAGSPVDDAAGQVPANPEPDSEQAPEPAAEPAEPASEPAPEPADERA